MLPGDWGALGVDFGCLGKRAGISSGYAVCSRLDPRRTLDIGILTLMAIVCCRTELYRRCAENASGGDYDAGDEDYYGAAEGSVKLRGISEWREIKIFGQQIPDFWHFDNFFLNFFFSTCECKPCGSKNPIVSLTNLWHLSIEQETFSITWKSVYWYNPISQKRLEKTTMTMKDVTNMAHKILQTHIWIAGLEESQNNHSPSFRLQQATLAGEARNLLDQWATQLMNCYPNSTNTTLPSRVLHTLMPDVPLLTGSVRPSLEATS